MEVKVLHEAGYEQAALGFSLSYNSTPERAKELFPRYAFKNTGENKFLESIMVWLDVKAPLYWWSQADTYRLSTKQSESTMHTLLKRLLNQGDFEGGIDLDFLAPINKGIRLKNFPWVNRHLPRNFLQRRVWCMSYKTLQNIVYQRQNHKLQEWQYFCEQVCNQLQHPEFISLTESKK